MFTVSVKGKAPLEIPREVRAGGEKAIDAYVADGGKAHAEKKAAQVKAEEAKKKGGSK